MEGEEIWTFSLEEDLGRDNKGTFTSTCFQAGHHTERFHVPTVVTNKECTCPDCWEGRKSF